MSWAGATTTRVSEPARASPHFSRNFRLGAGYRPSASRLVFSTRFRPCLRGIPCRRVAYRTGHGSADNAGRGDRSQSYPAFAGLGRGGGGGDRRGLDLLVDRISLPSSDRTYRVVQALRGKDRESAAFL